MAGEALTTDGGREFNPDWTIAPAELLQFWLEKNNLRTEALAVMCGGRAYKATALELITEVLDRKPLRDLNAQCLERGTGVPARFWLAFEHNYRSGLAAGRTDASEVRR